ncbi:MAG: tetratricopeptide repeat protein [Cyanobacteria bacterium J06555_13]
MIQPIVNRPHRKTFLRLTIGCLLLVVTSSPQAIAQQPEITQAIAQKNSPPIALTQTSPDADDLALQREKLEAAVALVEASNDNERLNGPRTLSNLAKAYNEIGDPEQAQRLLEKALLLARQDNTHG